MAYKTIVVDYAPKAKIMAAGVEDAANEMERLGIGDVRHYWFG